MRGKGNAIVRSALCTTALMLAACNPQQAVPPMGSAGTGKQPPAGFSVVDWGPRSTQAGLAFNVQADGNSGISFQLEPSAPAGDYTVLFDGKPLGGVVVAGTIMTTTIPAAYISQPGTYPVVIENSLLGLRVPAGDFSVVRHDP